MAESSSVLRPCRQSREEAKAGTPAASVARAFTAIYYPNDAGEDVWGSDAGSGGALRLWPAGSCEFLEASNPAAGVPANW